MQISPSSGTGTTEDKSTGTGWGQPWLVLGTAPHDFSSDDRGGPVLWAEDEETEGLRPGAESEPKETQHNEVMLRA